MTTSFHLSKNGAPTGRWLVRLLVGCLFLQLAAPLLAQERYLMIFDTSAAMKKRLPAVNTLITNLYATAFGGNLHAGDDIGVWTFDQKSHMGEFPLIAWPPENLADSAVDLITFLHKQHYSGETSFGALQPALGQVIADSERLTLLLVCDGAGEITWTPYNDGINQTLRRMQAERKTSRQPVVLVLRVEHGKFIGCAISFPPNEVNFPAFPAPKPMIPKITVTNLPPVAVKPVVAMPPLIIVGTKTGTNLAELTKELTKAQENKLASTPAPPHKEPAQPPVANPSPTAKTNVKAPIATAVATPTITTNATATNPPMLAPAPVIAKGISTNQPTPVPTPIPAPTTVPKTETNPPVGTAAPEKGFGLLLPFAAGALSLAAILIVVVIARSRRPRGSLITDSLNAPKGPLKK